jgi:light-harvesting complex II chlorophyll a/b binding protein 5
MLQKSFMGQSLKASTASLKPAQPQRTAPITQAFFKKAEKSAEKTAQKAASPIKGRATQALKKATQVAKKAEPKQAKQVKSGGNPFQRAATQVQKAAPKNPVKQAQKAAPKSLNPFSKGPAKQAAKEVKKAAPKQNPFSQLKKAAPKPPAKPFQKAAQQVKRAAPKQIKQAPKKQLSKPKQATTPRPIRQASRAISPGSGLDQWYGPSRALYLPRGLLDPQDIPSYLNGSLAGDYGYDPLGLGKDPAQVEKFRAYELIHARWAMLAAAGIVIPEGLQANGADIKGGTWFETGAEMLNGGTLNYFAVPFGIVNNPLPLVAITLVEVVLIGAVENYRRTQSGPPGYSPGKGGGKFDSDVFNGLDTLYPGGPFDPLGLADDPETLQELKVKEIKNGRLAMISVLGFAFQGYVTGEGPYANWAKHVSDPFGYNLLTVLGAEDRLPTL